MSKDRINNIEKQDFCISYDEKENLWQALIYLGGKFIASHLQLPIKEGSTYKRHGDIKQFYAKGKTEDEAIKNLVELLIKHLKQL